MLQCAERSRRRGRGVLFACPLALPTLAPTVIMNLGLSLRSFTMLCKQQTRVRASFLAHANRHGLTKLARSLTSVGTRLPSLPLDSKWARMEHGRAWSASAGWPREAPVAGMASPRRRREHLADACAHPRRERGCYIHGGRKCWGTRERIRGENVESERMHEAALSESLLHPCLRIPIRVRRQ